MAAEAYDRAMNPSVRARIDAVKERLRREDPDVLAAVADVDEATLAFAAAMSPLERLEAATANAHALTRFRRVPPSSR